MSNVSSAQGRDARQHLQRVHEAVHAAADEAHVDHDDHDGHMGDGDLVATPRTAYKMRYGEGMEADPRLSQMMEREKYLTEIISDPLGNCWSTWHVVWL